MDEARTRYESTRRIEAPQLIMMRLCDWLSSRRWQITGFTAAAFQDTRQRCNGDSTQLVLLRSQRNIHHAHEARLGHLLAVARLVNLENVL